LGGKKEGLESGKAKDLRDLRRDFFQAEIPAARFGRFGGVDAKMDKG
jgi:hypothetical protein